MYSALYVLFILQLHPWSMELPSMHVRAVHCPITHVTKLDRYNVKVSLSNDFFTYLSVVVQGKKQLTELAWTLCMSATYGSKEED